MYPLGRATKKIQSKDIHFPKTVLAHGPLGVGKSLIAKAIAVITFLAENTCGSICGSKV